MRLHFDLGSCLREIRNNRNMTQYEVAEKARIDEKHYGRIERNVCEPKICTIVEIGKALEIEPWIIVKRAQGL